MTRAHTVTGPGAAGASDSGKNGGAREEDGRPASQYAVGDRVEITYSRRDDPKDITATARSVTGDPGGNGRRPPAGGPRHGETPADAGADEPDAERASRLTAAAPGGSRVEGRLRPGRISGLGGGSRVSDLQPGAEGSHSDRGASHCALRQRGSQVWVEEESNSWHHPNNLRKVYWSNELGWVTIPDREDEVKKHGSRHQTPTATGPTRADRATRSAQRVWGPR